MPENGGYANASNAGAKIARGEWLVMMNSDILPQSQGWAQIMSDFLLENPKIGMVAPKLLYEDDSIQHAGMYFAHDARHQFYENKHYYKGYPSSYPAANKPRCTPAVTAACIMINRKLFTKMGMFTTDFVVGDYEDSDLCLKLFQEGYHCYYLPQVAMLHFERQSMNEHESATNARYYVNAWLHQQKWSSAIAELMKQY
jgi:GT2 family glycosyltransferase